MSLNLWRKTAGSLSKNGEGELKLESENTLESFIE